MKYPPLRHGIFLLISALALIFGYLLLHFEAHVSILALLFFALALFMAVVTAIVLKENWGAFLWPVLFLLLGLVSGHTVLLGMDILLGFSFTLLFFKLQQNAKNLLHFQFSFVVQPALKVFLLMLFLALGVGIFSGIPSGVIESKLKEGIGSLEQASVSELRIFGVDGSISGRKISDWLANILEKSERSLNETSFFSEIMQQAIAIRIAEECPNDPSCAQQIESAMRGHSLFANISPEADPRASAAVKKATQDVLELKVGEWGTKVNFSLIVALIFFLIFLPFAGIFSWLLTFLFALGFQLLRWGNVLHKETQPMVQEFFA